jgi:hypothetical protein
METGHQPETRHPAGSDGTRRAQLVSAAVAAPALSALVLITAAGTDAPLGAPDYWPWLLTGLQVLALWSAGTRRWWGWLLGAAVQLPWIAYAVDTGQPGFIPGFAVSAAVQTHSFLVGRPRSRSRTDSEGRRVQVYA